MSNALKICLLAFALLGFSAISFVVYDALFKPTRTQSNSNTAATAPVLGKLVTLNPRPPQPKSVFLDENGNEQRLSNFHGQVVLLNIWATWCVPCVKEMPSLDLLQGQLGGDDFRVVAISVDRSVQDAETFYREKEIKHLDFYLDKNLAIAQELFVKNYPSGLPISVLYDRKGQELARLSGGFDWVSETAISAIKQAISAPVDAPVLAE